MLTKVHERLGTAGFVIAIVALVAALGGGAYAASGGLSGKQKKEVEKIAKQYAGKPGKNGAPGATGPAGATGAAGSKGDTGLKGDAGAQGEKGVPGDTGAPGAKGDPGAPGASPTVVELQASDPGPCEGSGGAKIIGVNAGEEAFACNGGGTGGGFPATLPSGSTETGLWSVSAADVVVPGTVLTTLSFNIPLEARPTKAVLITSSSPSEEETEECPGTVAAPEAKAGFLCVYRRFGTLNLVEAERNITGTTLIFAEGSAGYGSWAVTAE
jgi:hypothetical protein